MSSLRSRKEEARLYPQVAAAAMYVNERVDVCESVCASPSLFVQLFFFPPSTAAGKDICG